MLRAWPWVLPFQCWDFCTIIHCGCRKSAKAFNGGKAKELRCNKQLYEGERLKDFHSKLGLSSIFSRKVVLLRLFWRFCHQLKRCHISCLSKMTHLLLLYCHYSFIYSLCCCLFFPAYPTKVKKKKYLLWRFYWPINILASILLGLSPSLQTPNPPPQFPIN